MTQTGRRRAQRWPEKDKKAGSTISPPRTTDGCGRSYDDSAPATTASSTANTAIPDPTAHPPGSTTWGHLQRVSLGSRPVTAASTPAGWPAASYQPGVRRRMRAPRPRSSPTRQRCGGAGEVETLPRPHPGVAVDFDRRTGKFAGRDAEVIEELVNLVLRTVLDPHDRRRCGGRRRTPAAAQSPIRRSAVCWRNEVSTPSLGRCGR